MGALLECSGTATEYTLRGGHLGRTLRLRLPPIGPAAPFTSGSCRLRSRSAYRQNKNSERMHLSGLFCRIRIRRNNSARQNRWHSSHDPESIRIFNEREVESDVYEA